MKRFFIPLILIAMILTSSCSDDDPTGIQLLGGDWILDNITLSSGESIQPPAPVNLSLIQSEDNPSAFNFTGTVICNQYGGDFRFLQENEVVFDGVAVTEQLCVAEDPTGSFQNTFFEVLGASAEFNIGENTIALVNEMGTTLNFSRIN